MWHNGDVITAQLPMHLHVEAMPDDPSLNAVLYGPIVLAGLVGREGIPDAAPYAGGDQLEFKAVPDPSMPSLAITGGGLSGCFQQTAPLEFTAKTSESNSLIRFVPFASVTHDRYSVYWKTT